MAKTFKKQWILYGAAVLSVGYAVMSVTGSQPEVERLEMKKSVNQSSFGAYIMSRGAAEPSTKIISIRPIREGRVDRVFVKPGDNVRAGQRLYALDGALLRNAYEEANAQVGLAQARLLLAESEIIAGRIGLDDAELKFNEANDRVQRYKPLLEDGISLDEFDAITSAAGQAANNARLALQKLTHCNYNVTWRLGKWMLPMQPLAVLRRH